jgi:hypothetical protein
MQIDRVRCGTLKKEEIYAARSSEEAAALLTEK